MRALAGLTVCVVYCLPAAADVATIRCEDPAGFHVYHGPGLTALDPYEKNKTSTPTRYGAAPLFILDSSRADTLLVIWGSYIPPELSPKIVNELNLKGETEEAAIVLRDEDQITALRKSGSWIYVYSLYPRLGYGIFSRHGHETSGKAAHWTYYGDCKFPE